jgi:hypothetical protein
VSHSTRAAVIGAIDAFVTAKIEKANLPLNRNGTWDAEHEYADSNVERMAAQLDEALRDFEKGIGEL